MNDDNWVVIWVRKGQDFPLLATNFVTQQRAEEAVTELKSYNQCREVIAVCRAGDLRSLGKA